MRPFHRFLCLIAFLLAFPSCADKPDEQPTSTEKDDKPRLAGRVASTPAGGKFVLIRAYGKWDVGTGAILTTQGSEGRTANLRTTGEKLGQFAAADIQSGEVKIGDGVYTTYKPPEPSSESEPEPEPELVPEVQPSETPE